MTRRQILRLLLGLPAAPWAVSAAALLAPGRAGRAQAAQPRMREPLSNVFVFAQLQYRGGEWDPNPLGVGPLLEELMLRTSIEPAPQRQVLTAADPQLFAFPFLYMAGRYEFQAFTPAEVEVLGRFLHAGGFLFADDALGRPGSGFDRGFRALIRQLFPAQELRRLPLDHSVFRSFYLTRSVGGRQLASPFLEGITIDEWTPVILSQNDHGGAWARDRQGSWLYQCVPGGEAQRKAAFLMGLNIIVYALSENYKRDILHHPFIKRRLNL